MTNLVIATQMWHVKWTVSRGRCLFVAVLAIAAATGGCSPHPASKLVGVWVPADPSTVGSLLEKGALKVEFAKDGRFLMAMHLPVVGQVAKEGTWKYRSVEGNKITLEIQLADDTKPRVVELHLLDENTMEFVPPAGPLKTKIRFARSVAI